MGDEWMNESLLRDFMKVSVAINEWFSWVDELMVCVRKVYTNTCDVSLNGDPKLIRSNDAVRISLPRPILLGMNWNWIGVTFDIRWNWENVIDRCVCIVLWREADFHLKMLSNEIRFKSALCSLHFLIHNWGVDGSCMTRMGQPFECIIQLVFFLFWGGKCDLSKNQKHI